jgi:hypothetical protein
MTDADLAAAVAAAVAAVLGFPGAAPPPRVTDASTASVSVARRYLYGDQDAVPPTELPDPTTGPDLFSGLVALAVRIYQDPSSPAGVMSSEAYIGTPIAEDLLAHVHHYLNPYRTAWGIA